MSPATTFQGDGFISWRRIGLTVATALFCAGCSLGQAAQPQPTNNAGSNNRLGNAPANSTPEAAIRRAPFRGQDPGPLVSQPNSNAPGSRAAARSQAPQASQQQPMQPNPTPARQMQHWNGQRPMPVGPARAIHVPAQPGWNAQGLPQLKQGSVVPQRAFQPLQQPASLQRQQKPQSRTQQPASQTSRPQ